MLPPNIETSKRATLCWYVWSGSATEPRQVFVPSRLVSSHLGVFSLTEGRASERPCSQNGKETQTRQGREETLRKAPS